MDSIEHILGNAGQFSKIFPGFLPRDSQQKMALAIQHALKINAQLVIEAGTGTGKTFGYLVPIFLSQRKTIISTGTKNLQDQLFFKDIPILKKIFTFPSKIVLLKGRANYLCLHRLQLNLEEGLFISKEQLTHLSLIKEWSSRTQTGDRSEIDTVPEDSTIWPYTTSTTENCLGKECSFYADCFVVKARQQAMSADIVIVNHHLFFADMLVQEEGFGELLPTAKVIVFDEAHHLSEIASQFFSTTFSSRQLFELARDSSVEASTDAKDVAVIHQHSEALRKTVQNMRAFLGSECRKRSWNEISSTIQASVEAIKQALTLLEATLKSMAMRSKGLENCWRRSLNLIERFDLLTGPTPAETIHWLETFLHSFVIQLTPMRIAEQFKKYIKESQCSWIFTSATLSINNNFKLFLNELGLDQAISLQLPSPFDYKKQSLLYVPRGMPDARDANYIYAMIDRVVPVLEMTKGRAFILFTSHKALKEASDILKNRIAYPLLLQGTLPKQQLIEEFKRLGNAVLLGTNSFWYGVDVRGETLSCVIIDKLPFASPDDPLLKAKMAVFRKNGQDPFLEYQLPSAVLILKQGAGRLIRDLNDKGILMICDPRIIAARYGDIFLKSLPNMSRTREFEKVKQFFENTTLDDNQEGCEAGKIP